MKMRDAIGFVAVTLVLCGCAGRSVELDRYVLKAGPIEIKGVPEASGLAFSSATGTLLVADDRSTKIVELKLDGTYKGQVRLKGFRDVEGIVHVAEGKYALVDEGEALVCQFTMANVIKRKDTVQTQISDSSMGNNGLEGICYDPTGDRFFVVKEWKERKIYEFPRSNAGASPSQPWDIEKDPLKMDDLSGLHYHAPTGHLLILSDESKCLVECTTDGKEIARLPLQGGSAGLAEDIGQPEGVTMDADGNRYVIAEPNQFYVFSKE